MRRWIFAAACLLLTPAAQAADACPDLRMQSSAPDVATRIAAIACNENVLWYRPFIGTDGRVASATVMEAEAGRLADGATQPWRRVATYWFESGLLSRIGVAGASDCAAALVNGALLNSMPLNSMPLNSMSPNGGSAAACRAFVLDTPWSAAFVSWVMARAGVPGFRSSASHFDYVADAWRHPDDSPFLPLDPATATPGAGDLLCFARLPDRVLGYAGLVATLQGGAGSLEMHCDIVAAVNPGGDGKAYLIGGNVQQAVTMRLLDVNRNGNFWGLPRRTGVDPACSPDSESSCNFSRQDWAVLLKLKPTASLAQIRQREGTPLLDPLPAAPAPTPTPTCCVYCVVGANPPVARCPATGKP